MSVRMNPEPMVLQLLAESAEDHLGLWWIIGAVEDTTKDATPEQLRTMTLAIIRELLEKHGFRAGFPGSDGRSFKPWLGTVDEIVGRIECEWRELGHEPIIGDVVWLTKA